MGTSQMDVDKAVATLTANASTASQHACAKFVRLALEAGGVPTGGHPVFAKSYAAFLQLKGFETVGEVPPAYRPLKGDVVVFESYPGGNPAGHIQMYSGSQWVSDFFQTAPFWPGAAYETHKTPYTILRP